MGNLVKEALQINRGTPLVPLTHYLLDMQYRLMLAPPLSKSKIGFREGRFEDFLEHQVRTLCDHPVHDRRYPKCPHLASPFGYKNPSGGFESVHSRFQLLVYQL